MANVATLVSQMTETLATIQQTVASLDTSAHNAQLDELERKRDEAISSLRSVFDEKCRSEAQKRQGELTELAQRRRKEDEERERKRREEDEQIAQRTMREDDEREARLEEEVQLTEEEIEEEMNRVEDDATRLLEEGKRRLRELEEKRMELNQQMNECLSAPVPVFTSRRKPRGSQSKAKASSAVEKAGEVPRDSSLPSVFSVIGDSDKHEPEMSRVFAGSGASPVERRGNGMYGPSSSDFVSPGESNITATGTLDVISSEAENNAPTLDSIRDIQAKDAVIDTYDVNPGVIHEEVHKAEVSQPGSMLGSFSQTLKSFVNGTSTVSGTPFKAPSAHLQESAELENPVLEHEKEHATAEESSATSSHADDQSNNRHEYPDEVILKCTDEDDDKSPVTGSHKSPTFSEYHGRRSASSERDVPTDLTAMNAIEHGDRHSGDDSSISEEQYAMTGDEAIPGTMTHGSDGSGSEIIEPIVRTMTHGVDHVSMDADIVQDVRAQEGGVIAKDSELAVRGHDLHDARPDAILDLPSPRACEVDEDPSATGHKNDDVACEEAGSRTAVASVDTTHVQERGPAAPEIKRQAKAPTTDTEEPSATSLNGVQDAPIVDGSSTMVIPTESSDWPPTSGHSSSDDTPNNHVQAVEDDFEQLQAEGEPANYQDHHNDDESLSDDEGVFEHDHEHTNYRLSKPASPHSANTPLASTALASPFDFQTPMTSQGSWPGQEEDSEEEEERDSDYGQEGHGVATVHDQDDLVSDHDEGNDSSGPDDNFASHIHVPSIHEQVIEFDNDQDDEWPKTAVPPLGDDHVGPQVQSASQGLAYNQDYPARPETPTQRHDDLEDNKAEPFTPRDVTDLPWRERGDSILTDSTLSSAPSSPYHAQDSYEPRIREERWSTPSRSHILGRSRNDSSLSTISTSFGESFRLEHQEKPTMNHRNSISGGVFQKMRSIFEPTSAGTSNPKSGPNSSAGSGKSVSVNNQDDDEDELEDERSSLLIDHDVGMK